MSVKVGINGFGRIGRQVLKAFKEKYADEFDVVAVNDLFDPAVNAHLFKYDSNFGKYAGTVELVDGDIVVDGDTIKVFAERDPAKLPWGDLGAEIVIESTGVFRDGAKAAAHIQAGAKKVIISAPAKPADSVDLTVVLGVNDDMYDAANHNVLSNASCTTNCLAPPAKVIHENFGIAKGLMTTIHAYTLDQRILDQGHSDMRRARAAALNIIPTTTGAAKAVSLVLPELDGKLNGLAIRVPTPNVSLVDFVATVEKPDITISEINSTLKAASEESLAGILGYSEEPLVSVDYNGCSFSSVVDAPTTYVVGNMVKVLSWYDNESGYSHRMVDLASMVGSQL